MGVRDKKGMKERKCVNGWLYTEAILYFNTI